MASCAACRHSGRLLGGVLGSLGRSASREGRRDGEAVPDISFSTRDGSATRSPARGRGAGEKLVMGGGGGPGQSKVSGARESMVQGGEDGLLPGLHLVSPPPGLVRSIPAAGRVCVCVCVCVVRACVCVCWCADGLVFWCLHDGLGWGSLDWAVRAGGERIAPRGGEAAAARSLFGIVTVIWDCNGRHTCVSRRFGNGAGVYEGGKGSAD
jgi:hypothetical protein